MFEINKLASVFVRLVRFVPLDKRALNILRMRVEKSSGVTEDTIIIKFFQAINYLANHNNL